jgi:hypothetical protein
LVYSGNSSLFERKLHSDTPQATLSHSSAGSSQGTRTC